MIKIIKNIDLKSDDNPFGNSINNEAITSAVDDICRAVDAFDIGEEKATVIINYNGYAPDPFIKVDISAASAAMVDRIQEIVDRAY